MKENIRVVTLKENIPADTVSHKGFHLLNMGKEGTWLVDEEHPGYPGCVKKAMHLAAVRGDKEAVEKYSKYPKRVTLPGKKVWIPPVIKLAPEAKDIADKIEKKNI